jgi:hypothetical protein
MYVLALKIYIASIDQKCVCHFEFSSLLTCNVNVNEMYLYSFNADLFAGFCGPYDELRTNASVGTAIF